MAADDAPEGATRSQETPDRPLLRVVDPDATPEEVAALVAVLASLGREGPPPRRVPSVWASPARAVRRTLPHGPGGWRASGLPR